MVNQRIVKEGFRRGLFSGKIDKGGWGWAEEGIIDLKIRSKRGESQGRERFWEIDSVGVKVYNMES